MSWKWLHALGMRIMTMLNYHTSIVYYLIKQFVLKHEHVKLGSLINEYFGKKYE